MARALLLLLGLLLPFLLAEGLARIFLPPALTSPLDSTPYESFVERRRGLRERQNPQREGRAIYDIEYIYDEFGRRRLPRPPRTERALLLFGDSVLFGEGIEAENSIPALLQARWPKVGVYCYADRGFGPNNFLWKAERGFAPGEVRESRAAAIYFFGPHQLARAIGSMRTIQWTQGKFPYYAENGDEIELRGTFTTGRPSLTRWYWWIGQSAFVRWLGADLPGELHESSFRRTCLMLRKALQVFQERGQDFFVALAFDYGPVSAHEKLRDECLNPAAIPFLELPGDPVKFRELTYHKFGDHHPTSAGAKVLAEKLITAWEAAQKKAAAP